MVEEQKQDVVAETKPEGEQAKPEVTLEELQRQMVQLQETIKQKDETAKKFEDNWKNEQRVSGRHAAEVERYKRDLDDRKADRDLMKLLAASIAEQKGQSEEAFTQDVKQRQGDLLTKFNELEHKQEVTRRQREVQAKVLDYQQKVEVLGLTEADDSYWDIRELVEGGNFARADVKIARLERQKQTLPKPVEQKPTHPQESEDDRIKKAARKMLEDQGLLTQETGGPTAPPSKDAAMYAKYANGEISFEDYSKWEKSR